MLSELLQAVRTGGRAGETVAIVPVRAQVDDLIDAANETSGQARTAWYTMLAVGAYLGVVVGATTHKDLLLGSPVTLPLFEVALPLFTFFWIGPAVVLLLHVNLLVIISVLARKLERVEVELHAVHDAKADRDRERARIDSFVFTQMMIGLGRSQQRLFVTLIVWITVVIAPIALLLAFQISFLPYHDTTTTWWHRIALVLDLLLIWTLWRGVIRRPGRRRIVRAVTGVLEWSLAAAASVMVVAFSILVATIPDEATEAAALRLSGGRSADLTEALFEGRFVDVARSLDSPFTRNIVLPDAVLIDKETLKDGDVTVVLRGRDLRYAQLDRADLRGADLTGVDLRGAQLIGTNLQRANLKEALLDGAHLEAARLQGANLFRAYVRGAILRGADLRGAFMGQAKLQGAALDDARLQGAYLHSAKLWGAGLVSANFSGAYMERATLLGSEFDGADLSGVDLEGANVWYASIDEESRLQLAMVCGARTALEETDREEIDFGFSLRDVLPLRSANRDWRREDVVAAYELRLRDPVVQPSEEVAQRVMVWEALEDAACAAEPAPGAVAALLADIACLPENAPHVARGMLVRMGADARWGSDVEPYVPLLAARLMSDTCAGAQPLSEEEKLRLRELASG